MSKWSLACLNSIKKLKKKKKKKKKQGCFIGPVFEIAQVESRKRGQKTGTLSNVRKPNQTECFYLKEDV